MIKRARFNGDKGDLQRSVIDYLTHNPDKTCVETAKALGIAPQRYGYGGLSCTLFRLTQKGTLTRRSVPSRYQGKIVWRYSVASAAL